MPIQIASNVAVTFSGVAGTVSWLSFWDALNGGEYKGRARLRPEHDLPFTIDAGNVIAQITESPDVSRESDKDGMSARAATFTHVQAHDDDPEDGDVLGTANVISGLDRQPITWAAATEV